MPLSLTLGVVAVIIAVGVAVFLGTLTPEEKLELSGIHLIWRNMGNASRHSPPIKTNCRNALRLIEVAISGNGVD